MIEPSIEVSSKALLDASNRLGSKRLASFTRACVIPLIFDSMERAFGTDKEPVGEINSLLELLAVYFNSAGRSGICEPGAASIPAEIGGSEFSEPVENVTGNHYGRLFSAFSTESFWQETVHLLKTRLDRNGIDITNIGQMKVLDAGCGGGRYTVAWRQLGAKAAVGVDISSIGLESARKRVTDNNLADIEFQIASVLELPFPDNSFEIVFSNGVLHHTVDWKAGISELVRVLKPGGLGWLYLIENPGGLFWGLIDVMRELMKNENKEFARLSLKMIGIPDNRIFYMLDHVMVPINIQLTPAEIEDALKTAGAVDIRRLQRGTDFDRIESIYRRDPYAEVKYGVGENRYVFTKK